MQKLFQDYSNHVINIQLRRELNQSPERNGQKLIVHKAEQTITITYITKVQTPTRTNGETNTPLLGVLGLYQLAMHLKLLSELTFLLPD